MTREECESKILEKLKDIKKIYESYNCEDKYLIMVILTNSISFNNSYFRDDYDLPVIDKIVFLDEDENNDN